MAKFADLKGLNNFRKKVSQAKLTNEDLQLILNRICEKGIEYARSLYGGTESITLSAELNGNIGTIVAEGETIAYLEFGTGERGQGTYEGNLPENQLTFYSTKFAKDIVLEYGWTYSYANKIDENQPIWQGRESQAQMWKTAQYLRQNLYRIVQEVVKK